MLSNLLANGKNIQTCCWGTPWHGTKTDMDRVTRQTLSIKATPDSREICFILVRPSCIVIRPSQTCGICCQWYTNNVWMFVFKRMPWTWYGLNSSCSVCTQIKCWTIQLQICITYVLATCKSLHTHLCVVFFMYILLQPLRYYMVRLLCVIFCVAFVSYSRTIARA